MESGRKKYLKNFIVLIDNTLMRAIEVFTGNTRRFSIILTLCSLE